MNVYSLLTSRFPTNNQSVCLQIPGGRDRTWDEIEKGSARMASWIATLGLDEGARIAAPIDKSPEGLMLYLACLRAGMVFLPLNTAYRAAELQYFFENAGPSLVVCPQRTIEWMEPIARRSGVKHVATLNDDETGSLLDSSANHSDQFKTVDLPDTALASILYTSGTTGRSKGAMLSHGNLGSNARVLHDYWGWSPDDVLLHMLPIFHIHGLFVAVNGALLAGAKMIWLPKFDVKAAIANLPQTTLMMGVPTFYVRLIAEPEFNRKLCSKVRLFISGSAPLLPETFTSFRERNERNWDDRIKSVFRERR
jgi:malonyl-CoA/methylmalonyl-CoA synthetase